MVQAIRLTGAWQRVCTKNHVAATGWEGNPFVELNERLRADPTWRTHRIDCAHDIPRLSPAALTDILLELELTKHGDPDADKRS
ncbi:hypothetical protein P0M04_23220 [Telluria mixta]|uniref:hypothetical protein n=1 Tax=Telluria mixta TaxID=34071 RepID=UPI002479F295|nr:hypothetical protein [Telluria mixta]WEM94384.1 hypothetical protein P0M04_23220 [Telluria mixta]